MTYIRLTERVVGLRNEDREVMIRIIKDGEVLKETEDVQTLVQYMDYHNTVPKYIEIRSNDEKIEERHRRQTAELSD